MSRPVGAAGLALIKQFEGCRLTAYKPVPNEKYWTIGWGHYGPDVQPGQTITQAEADRLLVLDCQSAANAVDNAKYCPLTAQLNANQRDALISFTFNCGVGNLRTLCRNRTLEQIYMALPLYNKGNGGKVLPGLVRRRKAEQELFITPEETGGEEEGENMLRYNTVAEVPSWAQAAVQKLVNKGYLGGNGQGLDLSHDMVRLLVVLDRAGAFDCAEFLARHGY